MIKVIHLLCSQKIWAEIKIAPFVVEIPSQAISCKLKIPSFYMVAYESLKCYNNCENALNSHKVIHTNSNYCYYAHHRPPLLLNKCITPVLGREEGGIKS